MWAFLVQVESPSIRASEVFNEIFPAAQNKS